jgi:hypothetical protein
MVQSPDVMLPGMGLLIQRSYGEFHGFAGYRAPNIRKV